MDRRKYLSQQELDQLRQHAKRKVECRQSELEWLLIDLATQTGLRVSELVRLKVGDVDPRCCALKVVRSKKRGKAEPEWLPVSVSLMRHLVSHLGGMGTISPGVSLWRDGLRGPWTIRGMQQAWKRVCVSAGLPADMHIHQARHTLAVALLRTAPNPGQALRLVQKQLGHESPETTAKLYADVPWEDRAEALDKLFAKSED